MKNSNSAKNQQMADPEDRKQDKPRVRHTTAANDGEKNDNREEKITTYHHNRGFYSRNGGDKGYRGL